MAIIIKTPIKRAIAALNEIKKHASPGRKAKQATEDLFGIWEGRNISIKKIRTKNTVNKWS
ncbi:MAG: hypothetical protein M3Z92_14170 [Bacteroidota bacterium]|nr:hypothetical protein [Bacteroidota bacterium]